MHFPQPLIQGRLVKRYKRFLADVALPPDDHVVTAHTANPGKMWGVTTPGLPVWLSKSDNPKRKLPYSWELVALDGVMIGINTALPNPLVAEALQQAQLAPLTGYDHHRREVKYGDKSRVDFLLQQQGRPDCYLEVKNVHMSRSPGLAEFPDAKTSRGARHLAELSAMRQQGARAVNLFVVQRADCDHLDIARDIDPNYDAAFKLARENGVEMLAYRCQVETTGIRILSPIEIL